MVGTSMAVFQSQSFEVRIMVVARCCVDDDERRMEGERRSVQYADRRIKSRIEASPAHVEHTRNKMYAQQPAQHSVLVGSCFSSAINVTVQGLAT